MAFAAIAVQLGIQIGLWAINRYLLDDSRKLPSPRPEGLEFAQATIGAPIPYIAGTIRSDNGVLVWHGNHETPASGVYGEFIYRVDLLLIIGTPIWDETAEPWSFWRSESVPKLRRLWYGDKQYPSDGTPLRVLHGQAPQIAIPLGGGGAYGDEFRVRAEFFDGRDDQTLVGSLTHGALTRAGVDVNLIPGYRHRALLGIVSQTGGIGFDPHVAPIGVEASFVGPDPIGPVGEFGQPLGLDANPAWVIYDLLCRPVWGIGYPPALVDLPAFQDAASVLVTEGNGCSVLIQRTEDASKVIATLLIQIDAVLFEDPATGLVRLRLIRRDYDVETIPVIDSSKFDGRSKPVIDRTSPRECIGEVSVTFTSRARGYKTDAAVAQKSGQVPLRPNQHRPLDFDAPCCMTSENARAIAGRELAQGGTPFTTIKCRVNRQFYGLVLGDVVWVDLPQDDIAAVFRVLEVDYGQLADGAITLRLIEDIFGQTAGAFPVPVDEEIRVDLLPLTVRYFDESPYLLSYFAALYGAVNGTGQQRVLSLAAPEPTDPATQYRLDTAAGGPGGVFVFGTQGDVTPQPFPVTGTIVDAYPRTADPYDMVTGLLVTNLAHGGGTDLLDFGTPATPAEIRTQGRHLAILGAANLRDADGEPYQVGEIIAWETTTEVSPGVFQLENVWRGLLDTAPLDHPAGTRFWMLTSYLAVGRRDWTPEQYVRGISIPLFAGVNGSEGDDATDDIYLAGRASLPARAADMRVRGYDLEGTAGPNAVVQDYPYRGDFKAVTVLEGAFDVVARENLSLAGVVVRGDEDSWSALPSDSWTVRARKRGSDVDAFPGSLTGLTSPEAPDILLGGDDLGHGTIDVYLDTVGPVAGRVGLLRSWQSPAIEVQAPTWRNLLAYDSFDAGALAPAWTAVVGTVTVEEGTDSLQRYAAKGYWLRSASAVAGVTTVRQTVEVGGYVPTGLTALVSWYVRNFDADGDDFSTATIAALDASGAVLTSATSSNIIGPTSHWRRAEVTLTLPAGTSRIRVDVSMSRNNVDDLAPSSGVTRPRLQVGQMGAELLTNPSFDGALTGWTTVVGGFVVNTANHYSSRNGTIGAAQGGAFSVSQLRQAPAVSTGYKYGVALLTLARSTTIDGDEGEVVLTALDGGGLELAAVTTGPESALTAGAPLLDVWERRRLALQLPDGTASLRVDLIAARAAGAGNSGACFDDLSLRIHKDLDPAHELVFDFDRGPVRQPAPTSWQRFHLAFPSLPVPMLAWDGRGVLPSVRPSESLSGPTAGWSDGLSHEPASFHGFWRVDQRQTATSSIDLEVIDAYQFTRASAGGAVDLQAYGDDGISGEEYGAFALDEPFAVAVLFRLDEPTFVGASGLAGRRSLTGVGWGLRIDAAGKLVAALQGASGAVSATGGVAIIDRAPHWGVLVNDPSTSRLYLYDDLGSAASASTAAVGSLAAGGVPLRIGRDGPASGTGGLQIARVYVWREALDAGQLATLMQLGGDPTGLLTTAAAGDPTWLPAPDGEEGARLVRCSAASVPIAYLEGRYGAAVSGGGANRIPSHNVIDWTAESGVTLFPDLVDPTGLPRGARAEVLVAGDAVFIGGLALGADAKVTVVLYARSVDTTPRTMTVALYDDTDTLTGSETVVLTTLWQRIRVELDWTAATPIGALRFSIDAAGTFDLGHVMQAEIGIDPPVGIWDAATSAGGTILQRTSTLWLQANHEGELVAEGRCTAETPAAGASLVEVDEGGLVEGLRGLLIGSAGAPQGTLIDDSSASTTETGAAIDWSQPWEIRWRWNRLELPESLGDQVGLVVDGSVDSAAYDPVAFTVGTGTLDEVWIGGDPNLGTAPNAIIHRVVVRAREQKLP